MSELYLQVILTAMNSHSFPTVVSSYINVRFKKVEGGYYPAKAEAEDIRQILFKVGEHK